MTKSVVLFICFLTSISWQAVFANTEIINFVATEEMDAHIPLTAKWPVLDYIQNEGQWRVRPAPLYTALNTVCPPPDSHSQEQHTCPNELWITLDLTSKEWRKYSKFTLRLSWPASSPADFLAEVYDPNAALQHHIPHLNAAAPESQLRPPRPLTRRKYARIRIVDTGVPTPSGSRPANLTVVAAEPVPFILILEPVYFGFLPASLLPVVLFLLPVVGLAGFAVPRIIAYMEGVARLARDDIGVVDRKME